MRLAELHSVDGSVTSEMASASKPGIDARKKLPSEGCQRPWPTFPKQDAALCKSGLTPSLEMPVTNFEKLFKLALPA